MKTFTLSAGRLLRIARRALVLAADLFRAAGKTDAVAELETIVTILDRRITKARRLSRRIP